MLTLRKEDGTVVCGRCLVADSALLRMKGLLGRAGLADDEGIYLAPAGSIHMFFMRFAIDAVFVDRDLRVTKVVENLRPWRVAAARGEPVAAVIAATSQAAAVLYGWEA